jgi:hypothetical protein
VAIKRTENTTANHATIFQGHMAIKTITRRQQGENITKFHSTCNVTSLHFYRELILFFAVSKTEEACHKEISTNKN